MDRPSTRGTAGSSEPAASDAAAPSRDDLQERIDDLQLTLDAQRQLLRARRPSDLVDTLRSVVHRAGATLVDGEVTGPEVLQIDIGLGIRPPALPWSPPDHPSRRVLHRLLPGLVEDATRVAHRLLEAREQADVSLRDDLTGGLSVGATARLLDKLRAGDAVVLVGLGTSPADEPDGGPSGPEAFGPQGARPASSARVELELRALAEIARSELDVDEQLCRLDTRSLAIVLRHAEQDRIAVLCQRVGDRWGREHDVPVLLGSVLLDDQADGLAASLAAQLAAARLADTGRGPVADASAGTEVRFHAAS